VNNEKKEFGVVGLGRMGGNLAIQAMEKGMRVVGFVRRNIGDELLKTPLVVVRSFSDLKKELHPPRCIFLYIPAGPVVDSLLDELSSILDKGDLLIDGGNSYWGDSIRRHRRMMEKGIRFIDLGTSGGIEGARHGACFMAGGDRDAVELIEPMLMDLAVPGGYVHAGPPGAGHFTKLVHNGIEFGMLQAIGEGIDLLEHYKDKLDVAEIIRCYRNGSVIRSWLIDLMEAAYRAEGGLEEVPSYVDDTGEVNWLVGDAMRMEVPVPVIAQSIMQLFSSRDDKKYWARAIAMMRHGFGGHRYGSDEAVKRERREGRVGECSLEKTA
jgi:6-phosphogluconate dehydrogenase